MGLFLSGLILGVASTLLVGWMQRHPDETRAAWDEFRAKFRKGDKS